MCMTTSANTYIFKSKNRLGKKKLNLVSISKLSDVCTYKLSQINSRYIYLHLR